MDFSSYGLTMAAEHYFKQMENKPYDSTNDTQISDQLQSILENTVKELGWKS